MIYEYLIRTANNCRRFGTAGANADIFRSLERTFAINSFATDIEKGIALGTVSAYMIDALDRMIRSENYNADKKEILQSLHDSLLNPTLNKIDEVLDTYYDHMPWR